MARNQMRHNVKDAAGNVIQNALCYVYETGTVTAVDDMYAASSGGSPVTTLTSNAQGDIEAWFDEARVVDIKVTDNSDAAYYPAVPARLLSWSEFTETVAVSRAGTHVALAAGPRVTNVSDSLWVSGSSQHGGGAGSPEQNLHSMRSPLTWLCLLSNGALQLHDNLGVNGFSSDDLLNTAMGPDEPLSAVTVAAASDADIIVLPPSRVDAGSAVSIAETIDNYDAMLRRLRAAGKFVVMPGLPPGTNPDDVSLRAAWAPRWAAQNRVPYIDVRAALVDPTTGEMQAAYTSDGVHFSFTGAKLMAEAVWDGLAGYIQPSAVPLADYQLADKSHPQNLLTNALFLVDGTSGRPADWTAATTGNVVHQLVEDPDGLGRWWQISNGIGAPTTSSTSPSQTLDAGDWDVGDVLAFGFEFMLDVTAWTSADPSRYFRLFMNGGAAFTRHELTDIGGNAALGYVDILEPVKFWTVCPPIPAGTTSVEFEALFPTGTYVARFRRPTVLNLTALGIE